MKLKDKKLFLLDMDGTIYLDNEIFEGTLDFLEYVRKHGGRCVYLSNNSSRGTDKYIEKLAKMGIAAEAGDFLTSTDATIRELKCNYPKEVLYVCGTESLKSQLRDAGIDVRDYVCRDAELASNAASAGFGSGIGAAAADADNITMLLLGYDTELNYEKLENCCILLNRGVKYMATHPDMVCPTWYGSAPDCGSVIEMLKTATGCEPVVIGKPKPDMAFLAMEKFGCSKEETCLIGDRVYTDIACGVNAGIDTILVLSGEGTVSDTEKYGIKPTWVFDNIRAVLNDMSGGKNEA